MNDANELTFSLDDRPESKATVLRLQGPLDTFTYPALKSLLSRWSRGDLGPPREHLAIDFLNVPYCASSGWSALFLQTSLLKERKRALVLFNMGERLAHSLGMLARGTNLIQVAKDEASALQALGQADKSSAKAL